MVEPCEMCEMCEMGEKCVRVLPPVLHRTFVSGGNAGPGSGSKAAVPYLIQAIAPSGSPISGLTGRASPPPTGMTKMRPLQTAWPHSVMRVKAR